jgi:hypothetical protein
MLAPFFWFRGLLVICNRDHLIFNSFIFLCRPAILRDKLPLGLVFLSFHLSPVYPRGY